MAKCWTKEEEKKYRKELTFLYKKQNKAIGEIASILRIGEQSVFKRMKRLGIKSEPHRKKNYLKKRTDIIIPKRYSGNIAEFFGVMLGDGNLSHFQVSVTLGTKEMRYAEYVASLMKSIFSVYAKICIRKNKYKIVYFGSVDATNWLFKEGLVKNKVKFQVSVPRWIFRNKQFSRRFIRGFFDTDGSIYKLRHGLQLSFSNRSIPLLKDLQEILLMLGYTPSAVSSYKIYITKTNEVRRFFSEIRPKNIKHNERFEKFTNASVG